MPISVVPATLADLPRLLPLVRDYHAFEEISLTDAQRENAVAGLVGNPSLGGIWLIFAEEMLAGYIAICTIYSIEFCGVDGFIDEFFIDAAYRSQGIGKNAFASLKEILANRGLRSLTLEVAHSNLSAQSFYAGLGFRARDRYGLMSCQIRAAEDTLHLRQTPPDL